MTIRHNADAERGVLGSAIVWPAAIPILRSIVTAEDFHDPGHALIWTSVLTLADADAVVDALTIADQLRIVARENTVRSVVDLEQLRFYASKSPDGAAQYARLVADLAVARRIATACQHTLLRAEDPGTTVEQLAEFAAGTITKASARRARTEPVSLLDCGVEAMRVIEAAASSGRTIAGASTGLADLDVVTAGLQPAQLVVLAARPSMGKSALGAKIAREVAERDGRAALFVSLEMSRGQLFARYAAERAGIDGSALKRGTLSPDAFTRFAEATNALARVPVYIDDDPTVTVDDIRARALALHARAPLGVVVVDYLQKVRARRTDRHQTRENEVSEIAGSLKALANELQIPVVALAQLNRGVENRKDRRPMLSDLRESGAIEQDADVVLFLYRDEYYNPQSPDAGIAEIIVAKQRDGATDTVAVRFIREQTSFRDLTDEERAERDERANAKPQRRAQRSRSAAPSWHERGES